MSQTVIGRRQKSIQIAGFSQKYSESLGRGFIYREIPLRLFGSFTYAAAANNSAVTLNRGDEWGLIQRVDIVANGQDYIRSLSGAQLKMLNRQMYGTLPRIAPLLGDGATASPTFDSFLNIPIWQPLAVKPMDTALNSQALSDLRIEVQTAPSNVINTANGPTAVSATLEVCSMESQGITGEFSGCRIYPINIQSPGANSELKLQLPVNSLYRGFIINAADGSADSATDLPNVITNVKLGSGNYYWRDLPWSLVRDYQRQRLGWSRDYVQLAANSAAHGTSAVFMRGGKSERLFEDSWAFLDLAMDGYLTEGIDSVGMSELFLEFNVTAACTITVIPIQLFPPRRPANGGSATP